MIFEEIFTSPNPEALVQKQELREFPSFAAAEFWMTSDPNLDLENADNIRSTFLNDPAGISEYIEIANHGCCGAYDVFVTINGKPAAIGCNYGH